MAFKKGHVPVAPFVKGQVGYWTGKKRGKHTDTWTQHKREGAKRWYANMPELKKKQRAEKIVATRRKNGGFIISEKTRQKYREAQLGKKLTEEHKVKIRDATIGSKNHFYERHHTEEAKQKNRLKHLGKKDTAETIMKKALSHKGKNIGEKNGAWQGGIYDNPYPLEFDNILKNKIRRRDDYRCQECNMSQDELGYSLHVHHIDYNKSNNNKNNLISLCNSCHMQTNFDRDDWMEYYQDKIMEKESGK
jgi:hypothetical protein